MFTTTYNEILNKILTVNPIAYAKSRNFIDGAVTYLSPYISRGVIHTKQVLETVLTMGYEPPAIEKFIQELAWRDYWQQIWVNQKSKIDMDLLQPQPLAIQTGIPHGIVNHQTGITAIDKGISTLYETGYMHNHIRMYVASLACNIAKCHWKIPAQWMYYYLLDADWASNALSWQWVCGANSNKLYYANQENINKYCHTNQANTFLDIPYEQFGNIAIPDALSEAILPEFKTDLPQTNVPDLDMHLPVLVYNFYNVDPNWRKEENANRVLLLEKSVFEKYPVSKKSLDFCIALAKENIPNIKIWVAEFEELKKIIHTEIYFKEHPFNNYIGKADARTMLTTVKGDFPSFFAFWKQCKKEIF